MKLFIFIICFAGLLAPASGIIANASTEGSS